MATLDQFQGCLLGLALGDALGAPVEGGIVERLVWRVIGTTRNGEMRWTDDTQMTIDLIESFLAKGTFDPEDLAARFAASYRWSRGYGPATAKTLKRISRGADWREANRSVYPSGSFGNGAAMRAPVLGLIYANRPEALAQAAPLTASVTHAHAIGMEGAVLLALATDLAARGCGSRELLQQATAQCALEPFTLRLAIALAWLESEQNVSTAEIVRQLGHGIAAHESCVTAVYLALRFRNQTFMELQRFLAAIQGDVDTIGAMAGAIWGAENGAANLPPEPLEKLEQRERLIRLATSLHRQVTEAPRAESK